MRVDEALAAVFRSQLKSKNDKKKKKGKSVLFI